MELALGLVPHVIMLEMNLPHVSGWDVITQLKSDAATANIPVIVHTASSDRQRAQALGITDFVAKPATPEAVIYAVKKVLAQGNQASSDG